MILARVVGNVVATHKHGSYRGLKMMLVRPVTVEGRNDGDEFVAADAVGSGPGERVIVVREGRSANDAVRAGEAPLDAAIIGIVDLIDLRGGGTPEKAR